MKKLIFVLSISVLAFSITAFGFVNWEKDGEKEKERACCSHQAYHKALYPMDKLPNPNFEFSLGSRFMTTVSKEKLNSAKSIKDLLPADATYGMEYFQNVKVAILNGDNEIIEWGQNEILNDSQLSLLKTSGYSTDFYIRADCKHTSEFTRQVENYDLVYYVTVVPEKEAEYKDGNKELVEYLKENSIYETADIRKEDLKPGRLHFIVSKNGTVENINLESTSGNEEIDQKMEELIRSVSGYWEPVNNSKGEKTEQEFVFSFGIIGC